MNHSENTSRAGNQQERLIKIGWITGFVDGEGCFSVGFVRQPDRKETYRIRRGYKTGYQLFHEFSVTQGEKSIASLRILEEFFGVGYLVQNKRHDNHKEHLYRFSVRRREDLLHVIIPFFRKYPMKTSKQKDFEKFVQCLNLISQNKHLKVNGVIQIARIASTMNRKKPRATLISILRDHVPKTV